MPTHLNTAKVADNDEYYTQYKDIHTILSYYKEELKGKKIYCNCDSPQSNFVKYLKEHYEEYELSSLTSTHYDTNGSYAYIFDGTEHTLPLKGSGDFRSDECREYLSQSDIIITNPPFSLFIPFLNMLIGSGKQFLIVGALTGIASKSTFVHILKNEVSVCGTYLSEFDTPYGDKAKVQCVWFTNMPVYDRKHIELTRTYDPSEYKRYVNYNAIHIEKLKDIPYDYKGIMGVPITVFSYDIIDEYKIVGYPIGELGKLAGIRPLTKEEKKLVNANSRVGNVYYKENGRLIAPFKRILIIHK